ncbi:hypothetical protein G6F60_012224 [Rhizopus arrhizus]|nr:hypothetical protein G6F41_012240 [Rhizopus arrhizus]KAG1392115.1 hypothetical protein G6F60_012224 [Rhizopus arrhizus]
MSALQDGRHTSLARDSRAKRLHLQIGPKGRLRRCTNPPSITKTSDLRPQGNSLQLQDASIWNKLSSTYLHKTNAFRCRIFKKKGNSNGILSRRPLYTGKDKRGNHLNHQESYPTFTRSRFFNKLSKKLTNPVETTRISRLLFQYRDDEDPSPTRQDLQVDPKTQASPSDSNPEKLQMDSQPIGQDDSTHTGNWRGTPTYPLPSERSGEEFIDQSTRLGEALPIILDEHRRTSLVEDICNDKEWTTDKTDHGFQTGHRNSCRCIGHWLGSEFTDNSNDGKMDASRKRPLDQCTGIEDDPLCTPITRKRLCREENQDYVRQHYCHKIYNKVGRNKFTFPTRSSHQDTRHLQHLQSTSPIPTHSRSQEHRRRQVEPTTTQPTLRSNHPADSLPFTSEEMGPIPSGRVCSKGEHATTDILELQSRSPISRDRCIPAELEETRFVLLSPLEIDSTCITQDQERPDTEDSIDHSILDSTTLVADIAEDTTPITTNQISTKSMDDDRMAIIREKQRETGLVDETIDFLHMANRNTTNESYDRQWKRYAQWCHQQDPPYNPREYNTITILNYLLQFQHQSYSQLKIIRTAISSIYKVLYPSQPNLADQKLIADFFRSKRQQTVIIPKQHQLQTWDSDVLTTLILQKYKENEDLNLTDLQQKTLLLLALSTMARPRSDLGRLQNRDVLVMF